MDSGQLKDSGAGRTRDLWSTTSSARVGLDLASRNRKSDRNTEEDHIRLWKPDRNQLNLMTGCVTKNIMFPKVQKKKNMCHYGVLEQDQIIRNYRKRKFLNLFPQSLQKKADVQDDQDDQKR